MTSAMVIYPATSRSRRWLVECPAHGLIGTGQTNFEFAEDRARWHGKAEHEALLVVTVHRLGPAWCVSLPPSPKEPVTVALRFRSHSRSVRLAREIARDW